MKKVISGVLLLIVLGIAGYYWTHQTDAQGTSFKTVSVQEAERELQKDPEIVLIDVRTPMEFYGPSGHVNKALLRPVQNISNWVNEIQNLKDKKLMIICQSGGRSYMASKYLSEHGFRRIINVDGGMTAWNIAGLPAVHEKAPTN